MRAVVHDRYGPADVLRLVDVPRPVPKDDEVLVRIHATTVNRTDTALRAAEPFFSRFITGLFRPRRKILGSELAGEVAATGSAVTEFEVGDKVFGVNPWRFGTHAEFVCMREGAALAHMPAGVSFEQAAAVCDGAILALGCLRRADLRKGRRVLIYGASGSIGTAGVQLAKYFDADVTAVCNTKNVETVRSLGADAVIDYTRDVTVGPGVGLREWHRIGSGYRSPCELALQISGIGGFPGFAAGSAGHNARRCRTVASRTDRDLLLSR